MKRPPTPSHAGLSLAAALVLMTPAVHAADDAALQRCRAMADAAVRLACYDALPLRVAPAKPAPSTSPPTSPAMTAPMTAPAAAAVPAPVLPAVAAAAVQSFGQERRDEPQTISSHIAGVFEGWGPNSRIKLANGQVWQVVDGSDGVYFLQNPKVTVKRALMGGFQIDIEGAKRTARVRRVE